MRLSDVKGDRAFDVIADIIDPICNIASDDNAVELFKRERLPEGEDAKQYLLKRAKKAVPALLRGHKDDLIAILSSVGGVDPAEYRKTLSMPSLIKDCMEMLTDEDLIALFTSAQTETNSGSAQGNTGAEA